MNYDWTYKIKTDKKNELFLCVIYKSPNSRDDNNKQLLDLIVELSDKRVDKLFFIGYSIGTGTVFTLDNGKSHVPTRQHGGTPLVVEYRSGESESKSESWTSKSEFKSQSPTRESESESN